MRFVSQALVVTQMATTTIHFVQQVPMVVTTAFVWLQTWHHVPAKMTALRVRLITQVKPQQASATMQVQAQPVYLLAMFVTLKIPAQWPTQFVSLLGLLKIQIR